MQRGLSHVFSEVSDEGHEGSDESSAVANTKSIAKIQ